MRASSINLLTIFAQDFAQDFAPLSYGVAKSGILLHFQQVYALLREKSGCG